jgi:hypothetical protein
MIKGRSFYDNLTNIGKKNVATPVRGMAHNSLDMLATFNTYFYCLDHSSMLRMQEVSL